MENKKSYECMIVVDAKLTEAKREELIAKFKKMAGEETTVEKLGQKAIYQIKHNTNRLSFILPKTRVIL